MQRGLFTLACAVAMASPGPVSSYNQPPKAILDVMRAPSSPQPHVNPTHDHLLLVSMEDYPTIARVAAPYLRLAGVRIEPRNHSRHDTPGGYGITPSARTYELVRIADGARTQVRLPKGGYPGLPVWSADGRHFAFTNTAPDAVELWVGETRTGRVRRVPGLRLNPMFGDDMEWMPDQHTLLVKRVPKGQPLPPPAAESFGPSIQESDGRKGQSSTYETRDTLTDPHDELQFDHYAVSELALVDSATLAATPLGKPGNYDTVKVAPDGQHILVTTLHRPYSYVVTYQRFPQEVEVWEGWRGSRVTKRTIASLPLAERVPIHGVPLGPRDFAWRATAPATLVWAEAQDGGDWNAKVPFRDKVMAQSAPFSKAPAELARTEQRFAGLAWTERPGLALLSEYDQNLHWLKTQLVNVDDPKTPPRLLWDMSADEIYGAPGRPVRRRLPSGSSVIRLDGDAIYLAGEGASPEGDRPFLDRLDLKTLKSERLFRSDRNAYELFGTFLGQDTHAFLTWHQSVLDPPNAWIRTLGPAVTAPEGEAAYTTTRKALTHLADPAPEVRAIRKQLVTFKRDDGLDLSFTLYTPPGYQPGTRVPTILYAYPMDYAEAAKAGQVAGSEAMFTHLRNYKLLLLAGYAIIDRASFPVVGDPRKAYDTYMEQLVADAKAAVAEAVRLGVADPERVGVTGHSHGALMTVNLLAHTDLFRAGVATSGSYNKTLTPFGFQNERRSVWDAPEVYQKVSPFFFADQLKTPLLIVHGSDDANPGTTPLQASKLYEAVRGNGGTVRLVMLPHEPHWYSALESNEQLVYDMLNWFDRYVKHAAPRAGASAAK